MTKREALAVILSCPIGTHINLQDLKFTRLHRAGASISTAQDMRAEKVDTPSVDDRGMSL